MNRRTRVCTVLACITLATTACGAGESGGTAAAPADTTAVPAGTATATSSMPDPTQLTAGDIGPAVERAMVTVQSQRATGTASLPGGQPLPLESLSLLGRGLISAREVWYPDDRGGATGYLGVDGQLYDKEVPARSDRDALPWRLLRDSAGNTGKAVDPNDVLLAEMSLNIDGRPEVVGYLLGAQTAQFAGTEGIDGRPTAHYRLSVPIASVIERSLPGEVENLTYARDTGGIDGWQLEVWLAPDLRPVKQQVVALDSAGKPISTYVESYSYDSPGDTVTAPGPTAVTTPGS